MEPESTPNGEKGPEQIGGINDTSVDAISVTGEGRIEIKPSGPIVPPPPPLGIQKDSTSPLKQIRTFEGDVAEAIKKQNESLVSIGRAEEKKREAAVEALPPKGEKSHALRALLMSLLTIVFVGAGGYGAYYAWRAYESKVPLPVIVTPVNQFIRASTITHIDASTLGRETLLATVTQTKAKVRESDSLEQLQLHYGEGPNTELVITSDFLFRLSSHAPAPLVRAFDKHFMLGLYGYPSHTFLMVKLASFENAFPGMLEWEPRLAEDLWPLVQSESVIDSIPIDAEFEDVVIENRDARVLKDNSGRTVLIYSFYDNGYLLITDNENTFRTLVNRLDSQKLSR